MKTMMIFVFFVHVQPQTTCNAPQKRSVSSTEECRHHTCVSDDQAVLAVLTALGWTEVIIIYDNFTDIDSLLSILHVHKITTQLRQLESGTTFTDALLLSIVVENFLVLGADTFILETFQTVAKVANESDLLYKLYDTLWVTTITAENMYQLENAGTPFENVAVIVGETSSLGQNGKIRKTLWTLRRDGDTTGLEFVTSLTFQDNVSLSRQRVLPNLYQGFGGRTLRVAVVERTYLLSIFMRNGSKGFQGVMIDLLQELSLRLNFTYVLLENENSGHELDNGQWSGIIGMLVAKEVDLGLAASRLTLARSSVADPTTPYNVEEGRLVYRKPTSSRDAEAWRFFLRPFQTGVYWTIGGSFAAVMTLLMLCEVCYHWLDAGRQRASTGRTAVAQWIAGDVGRILLASLLNKPPDRSSESLANRSLVCTWLLLGVVLTSLYGSMMTSSLAVTEQAVPFSSMADLVKLDTYTWSVQAASGIDALLKESSASVYRRFYQGLMNFAKSDPSFRSPSLEDHKQKVFRGNHAYLGGNEEEFEMWKSENCDITSVVVQGLQKIEVLYLQKGSPYHKKISREVSRIVEAGLVARWKKKWSPNKPGICLKDSQQSSSGGVHLAEVQTAFYLAAAGVGLAVLTLGLERSGRTILSDFIRKAIIWASVRK